jgi:sialate O-acetylesterase
LIHSSWGGTPAEAWTSADGLRHRPDYAQTLALLAQAGENPGELESTYEKKLAAWFTANDAGVKAATPWSAEQVDVANWKTMKLPTFWEAAGLPDFDGVVWFRREVDIPESWAGHPVTLHLGAVDDQDTTW